LIASGLLVASRRRRYRFGIGRAALSLWLYESRVPSHVNDAR